MADEAKPFKISLKQALSLGVPLVVIIGWFIVVFSHLIRSDSGALGTDFDQLWIGARAVLDGVNPYGAETKDVFTAVYGPRLGQSGLAYPLPAYLVNIPFALLPRLLARWPWLILVLFSISFIYSLSGNLKIEYLIPIVFLPLLRATQLMQPSLEWLGFAIGLIVALEYKKPAIAGFFMAILPAKPQAGFIIALAGFAWSIWNFRSAIWWGIGWGIVVWGSAFILVPTWVQDALANVGIYMSAFGTYWQPALGLVLVLISLRLPWWAVAATLQVIAFPMLNIYSSIPLLIAWMGIGGPIAVLGAALSWLWIPLKHLDFVSKLWICLFIPYMGAALWKSYSMMIDKRSV